MTHRAPRAKAPNALANHYRCRDGRWFIMALHNEPRPWHGFLAALGQHNDVVLQEAGYSADEIRRLRALGVLG